MSGTFYCRAWKEPLCLVLKPGTGNSQDHLSAFCSAATYSTSTRKGKWYPGRHVAGGMGQPKDTCHISAHIQSSHMATKRAICAQERAENGIWQTASRIFHTDRLDYRTLFWDLLIFHHNSIQNHFKVMKVYIASALKSVLREIPTSFSTANQCLATINVWL